MTDRVNNGRLSKTKEDAMTDTLEPGAAPTPSLADLQHWTWVMGRA